MKVQRPTLENFPLPSKNLSPISIVRQCWILSMARLCKRGFCSPRIWIPHPKTLADLDDPMRGFGSPAELDPSIYFVCDRLENDDVECWEPNPRTPKRGFGSPRGFGSRFPKAKNRRRSLPTRSMSLAHSD